MEEIKVNKDELAKLPISDLYAIFDSLESIYLGVDFNQEKTIISDEIDKRVKLVFPNFDKYKIPPPPEPPKDRILKEGVIPKKPN